MKKIFGILMIMILSVALCYTQNSTVDRVLSYSDVSLAYTGIASDTIGLTDSTWTYTVKKKTDARLYPYIYVEIDSISGTPTDVYIIRQGKCFPNESYTTIDTVTWAGSVDTTFVISNNTAYKYWYNRILIKGSTSSFKAEIQELDFKFLK